MNIFDINFSVNEEALKTAKILQRKLRKKPIKFDYRIYPTTEPYINGRERGYKIKLDVYGTYCFVAWSRVRNSDSVVVYRWSGHVKEKMDGGGTSVSEEAYRTRRTFNHPLKAARFIYKSLEDDIEYINTNQILNQ
jgi:hypothetical protein